MFPGSISVGFDVATKNIRKIMLHGAKTVLITIVFVVHCSGENCYQYRRKAYVTIDTDQCLWENYTEPKPKRFCLESCFDNVTVRTENNKTFGFFVLNPKLPDLAILCKSGLKNLEKNVTPSGNRTRALSFQVQHYPFYTNLTFACKTETLCSLCSHTILIPLIMPY